MKELKFGEQIINVTESWDELTIAQYIEYVDAIKDIDTTLSMSSGKNQVALLRLFEILSSVPKYGLDHLTIKDLKKIEKIITNYILTPLEIKEYPSNFLLNGVTYITKSKDDMMNLTLGEKSSVNVLQQKYKEFDYISRALAVLIRPGKSEIDIETKKEVFIQEEFGQRDIDNLEFRASLFLSNLHPNFIKMIDYFNDYEIKISDLYEDLFIKTEKVDRDEQEMGEASNSMVWIAMVDKLSQGDILKHNDIYRQKYTYCLDLLSLWDQRAKIANRKQ